MGLEFVTSSFALCYARLCSSIVVSLTDLDGRISIFERRTDGLNNIEIENNIRIRVRSVATLPLGMTPPVSRLRKGLDFGTQDPATVIAAESRVASPFQVSNSSSSSSSCSSHRTDTVGTGSEAQERSS